MEIVHKSIYYIGKEEPPLEYANSNSDAVTKHYVLAHEHFVTISVV